LKKCTRTHFSGYPVFCTELYLLTKTTAVNIYLRAKQMIYFLAIIFHHRQQPVVDLVGGALTVGDLSG
jgi:hypothetical protein